jgi:hypothetical protein
MALKNRSTKPSDVSKHNLRVAKKIKPASKLPKRYRGCIYGKSGSGKTRLVSTAPKVLVIDVNEEGTDSVRNDIDPNVFQVKFWQEINDVFWYLESGDHPYESVALDGITSLQTLCMKFVLGDESSRDASRDPDMASRQVYGKVNELMKTQIINFRNLPLNVLFTALERKKATGDDEDEEVEVFSSPQCSPGVANTLEAAVGMIGFLQATTVYAPKKEGEKKRRRVRRTRLLVGPSDRYLTKDRYGLMVPYVDFPNVEKMLGTIYGGTK